MSEEAKLLGKSISYPKSYSPEILVAVPRSLNREIYGIYEPINYSVVMMSGMPTKPVSY